MRDKLIIAHRGDTSSAIENTIEAFQGAIKKGADMIEFDVRRTKDGILVVHHDSAILRRPIKATSWQEIDKINMRRRTSVPRLEEVLELAKGKIKFDIEIKESGYEIEIIEMILRHLNYKDFIITSFDNLSIKRIKEKYPKVKTGLLLSIRKSKRKISELLSTQKYISNPADFFVSDSFLMRLGFQKRLKKYEKSFIVWGVNSRRMMKKMLEDDRVKGIITDKLEIALEMKRYLIKNNE